MKIIFVGRQKCMIPVLFLASAYRAPVGLHRINQALQTQMNQCIMPGETLPIVNIAPMQTSTMTVQLRRASRALKAGCLKSITRLYIDAISH